MILTPDELRSLAERLHTSPHDLLGMHLLGDGSGVVVRALAPGVARIQVQPVGEVTAPKFELSRIHEGGVRGLKNIQLVYRITSCQRGGNTQSVSYSIPN